MVFAKAAFVGDDNDSNDKQKRLKVWMQYSYMVAIGASGAIWDFSRSFLYIAFASGAWVLCCGSAGYGSSEHGAAVLGESVGRISKTGCWQASKPDLSGEHPVLVLRVEFLLAIPQKYYNAGLEPEYTAQLLGTALTID
jgi:hypothetical protein